MGSLGSVCGTQGATQTLQVTLGPDIPQGSHPQGTGASLLLFAKCVLVAERPVLQGRFNLGIWPGGVQVIGPLNSESDAEERGGSGAPG